MDDNTEISQEENYSDYNQKKEDNWAKLADGIHDHIKKIMKPHGRKIKENIKKISDHEELIKSLASRIESLEKFKPQEPKMIEPKKEVDRLSSYLRGEWMNK